MSLEEVGGVVAMCLHVVLVCTLCPVTVRAKAVLSRLAFDMLRVEVWTMNRMS